MCVPNSTNRRPQPVSFNAQQVSLSQSLISQRQLGSFLATQQLKQLNNSQNENQIPALFASSTNPLEKQRPKRRRKPQKPGKTAKNHDRHFVVHNYHDHALDTGNLDLGESSEDHLRRRGGVSIAFPLKLHSVLEQVEADGLAHIVSWQGHGRAFLIHNPIEFVDHIMPR
jgi:hypothetical protein